MLNNYEIISLSDNFEKDYLTFKKKYSHYFFKLIIIFLIISKIKFSYKIKDIIDKQKRIETNYNDPEIKDHSLYNLFKYPNYNDPEIKGHSLYNLFKYPQISILITNLENFGINELINFIINQSFKNIQFILYLSSLENKTHFNILKKFLIKDKRMEIFVYKKEVKLIDKIYYLIKNINGIIFLILI